MSVSSPGEVIVHRVFELPVGLAELREESAAEGYGHLQKLETDWLDGTNRFDEAGEALFAAFVDGVLAAVGGLNRDPYSATSPTGRIRRLYVRAQDRGSGLGRRLVEQSLHAAAGHFTAVCVRTPDSAAAAFYEALGFSRAPTDTATAFPAVQNR